MRKGLTGLLLGLAAALLVAGVDWLLAYAATDRVSFFDTLEAKTYDWRMQRTARPKDARQDLALVEIDEYSLQNLEANVGRWPWPRAVHSMIVDFLARAPARAIAYDVLFTEADTRTGFDFGGTTWSGEESDEAFADSVRHAGNVILLVNAAYEGEAVAAQRPVRSFGFRVDGDGAVERQVVFPPFDALADAAAGFAHNLLVFDPDGPVRHTIPFVRSRDAVLPSFGVAAASRLAGVDPSQIALTTD
jgi:adenylate cyclase